MNGGDIFTLQKILGHSTPVITSETYAHLSLDHMANAADRISFHSGVSRNEVILISQPRMHQHAQRDRAAE